MSTVGSGVVGTGVVVYTKGWCPYCVMAKRLLAAKGVEFTEFDVESDPTLMQKVMEDSGQRTVPQIWVGETHVGGFDQLSGLERAGKLDALLATAQKV